MARETFGSRLGFILISAGCAIGLGNVWRFPYITGQYGGAAFVVMYLLFLVVFALPILVMEFAVGRASHKGVARSFDELEPTGTKWHRFKWVALFGNYLLMMFYTTVAGWMLAFMVFSLTGTFNDMDAAQVEGVFDGMLADPLLMTAFMLIVVAIGVLVTRAGLRNGVERITKVMMVALFVVLAALCIRAVTLPGAGEGLAFYLLPDFGKLFEGGPGTFADAVLAAMGQAFFTVSVGVGSMSIFGSYVDKRYGLTGEASAHRRAGHAGGHHGRAHHLPGLLRLRGGARCRAGARVHHAAERLQPDARGAALGRAVLRVHERGGTFHRHRRVREHHELLHGPMGLVAQKGLCRQRRGAGGAQPALRAGVQPVGRRWTCRASATSRPSRTSSCPTTCCP